MGHELFPCSRLDIRRGLLEIAFPSAVLLFTLTVTLVLPDFGRFVAAGIENPICELIRPGTYLLDFQASPDAGPVDVYASSRPDLIDSAKPLLTIQKTPARFRSRGVRAEFTFI